MKDQYVIYYSTKLAELFQPSFIWEIGDMYIRRNKS